MRLGIDPRGRAAWAGAALLLAWSSATTACELVVGAETRPLASAAPDAGVEMTDATLSGVDAADDAAGDADTGGDADAGPPDLGISCGLDYCAPEDRVCCIGRCSNFRHCVGRDDAGAFTCPSMSGENCGWNQQRCDDSADCRDAGADAVCCGIGGNASCLRWLDCQTQPSHIVYCDPFASTPCPNGATCTLVDGGRPTCATL